MVTGGAEAQLATGDDARARTIGEDDEVVLFGAQLESGLNLLGSAGL